MASISVSSNRRAFVLAELAALVAIVAVVGAFLLVSASDTRRRARLADSVGNLQQFGSATRAFAADNANLVWTFTWRAGQSLSQYPDLNNAPTDLQAAANQAVDILRRRAGRTDITPITGWLPHIFYSHLPLADYLELPFPTKMAVSPEDHNRLAWQKDPVNLFFNLPNRPGYPNTDNTLKRWPYSSSYELGPAYFAPDAAVGSVQTVSQSSAHNLYFVGTAMLGTRRMTEVSFPSQKAMVYEQFQRSLGRRIAFFAYPEARVPILFADGSVSVRATSDANPGFQPNSPTLPFPTTFAYQPDLNWEPPTLNGTGGDTVTGRYRWTRWGLHGRDFGGPEVQSPP